MHKRPGRLILIMLALAAALVVINARGWLRPVRGAAGQVLNPIGGFLRGAGSSTGDFIGLVGSVKDLAARNARLEQEVASLRQRLVEDAELKVQNEALRKQLRFGEAQPRELIPAEVIAYQPDNFRGFITIGRGKRDNIKEGMAVVAEGSLVGRISEVSETNAKVWLLTDPDFKVNGLDQSSRATGTVRGQIGSGLVMDKIPQDQAVKAGDIIITSGLGGEVPRGLIIGQVESVNQKDNAVFQTAQLVSDVKFQRLELVFVVQQ
ncbi:MAG TPA: rod shape-determining protein MreC [Candidatus Saccharimonadales bacterium]|nr:rod shape-determining protein MreC [Candidatus Saccharimonadales bacterium]